ncbi:MAG: (d)CMP kinase [Candidatus Marinimicrobia bacterium]|jgi:cytidylate kinase|nr:(d)CMP kinase [Candidatus Neomarinimicrobiota bacterium]|tara:strand:- start:382 stop:1044 length:663 start_codon:yes stop_codon:yes gene_type:complete
MVIAIDGPAASGKSTTAQGVAKKLGFIYLDTGAMYRAVTLAVLEAGLDSSDMVGIESLLREISLSFDLEDSSTRILLNARDVSEQIRGLEVTRNVSAVSALPVVREKMVEIQRQIGSSQDSVVEGRDIGTVVFPGAKFKFFITADYETRAARRQQDLEQLGIHRAIREIIEDLKKRDLKDSRREHSPLTKAEDAIEIDTTTLTIQEQIDTIVGSVKRESN